jgi:hypothetical protein
MPPGLKKHLTNFGPAITHSISIFPGTDRLRMHRNLPGKPLLAL